MKLRFFTLVTLFFAFTGLSMAQNDPKSDAILKDSKNKFNQLGDISGNITYTLENPSMPNGKETKQGTFGYKKGKYFIKFPNEQIYCDLKKVWVYMVKEKEVNVSTYNPAEDMSVDRVYKTYETDTKSKYEKETVIGGITYSHISLFSIKKDSEFWKYEVFINKSSGLMEQMKMTKRNGSVVTYLLSAIKTNAGLSDTGFTFTVPAGVDVIDLDE